MDFQPRQIVLVDTNVILEAHQTGCWIPLANYFALHTVEKVVEETQTGFQNRDPEHWIDEAVLRAAKRRFVYAAYQRNIQQIVAEPRAILTASNLAPALLRAN